MIIPVHKKGACCDLANWRPKNYAYIVSRIMEHLNNDGLIAYLLEQELTYTGHLGFLRRKSRANCMSDRLNLISKALNIRRVIVVIVLDLAKAFDCLRAGWQVSFSQPFSCSIILPSRNEKLQVIGLISGRWLVSRCNQRQNSGSAALSIVSQRNVSRYA